MCSKRHGRPRLLLHASAEAVTQLPISCDPGPALVAHWMLVSHKPHPRKHKSPTEGRPTPLLWHQLPIPKRLNAKKHRCSLGSAHPPLPESDVKGHGCFRAVRCGAQHVHRHSVPNTLLVQGIHLRDTSEAVYGVRDGSHGSPLALHKGRRQAGHAPTCLAQLKYRDGLCQDVGPSRLSGRGSVICPYCSSREDRSCCDDVRVQVSHGVPWTGTTRQQRDILRRKSQAEQSISTHVSSATHHSSLSSLTAESVGVVDPQIGLLTIGMFDQHEGQ